MSLASGTWSIGWTGSRARAGLDEEYRPFPDVERRNAYQQALEVPAMLRALALPRGGRVLEVGCGRGVAIPALLRGLRPTRFTGLDVDPELLRVARARLLAAGLARRAELALGDVRELPFPDGSFDVVVDFGTCFHVSRCGQALREIARVLRGGGLFVHETRLNQALAHPVRSRGRCLPWREVPALAPRRHALLWASRVKAGPEA